jgi:hypothetical protein
MASIRALSGSLQYHEGRGLASFFYFHEDPKARLTKQDAKKLAAAIDYKEDPETALRCYALGFYRQAKLQGLDIPALTNEICGFIREKKSRRNGSSVETAESLAHLLTLLAPNESPEDLKARFLALAEDVELVDEAVAYLHRCIDRREKDGGNVRNAKGFLLLRKQLKKATPQAEGVA